MRRTWDLARGVGLAAVVALAACGGDEGLYFIPGSGVLPDCDEAPSRDLGGAWYDTGAATVRSTGCTDDGVAVPIGTEIPVCALRWEIEQNGNDVDVVVDDEYRIDGRLCGDQLHLRGGWWVAFEDEPGVCTYEEGREVGIESEGNTLTVGDTTFAGTLRIREACAADYEVVFYPY